MYIKCIVCPYEPPPSLVYSTSSGTKRTASKETFGEAATTDRRHALHNRVPERGPGECTDQHRGAQEHELRSQGPQGCPPAPVSDASLASYPGLPSQLFSKPWKKSVFHGCEKSCEGRPGFFSTATKKAVREGLAFFPRL